MNFNNQKVLIRVDFNVPLDKEYRVTDSTRIEKALPTINEIIGAGGSVILMSHLGRPQKKKKEDGSIDIDRFTLRHVAPVLSNLLDKPVKFAADCIDEASVKMSEGLKKGEVLLLENTRFHAGEEKGDVDFAKALAVHGDIYLNDAFGSAHRAHASTAIIAQFFSPERRGFGELMKAEIKNANLVLNNPKRPLVAITGGAKVSDKLLLLERLIEFADKVIVGGGMAYTFIKAQGGQIGNSICEDDKLQLTLDLLDKALQQQTELLLPVDNIAADAFSPDARTQLVRSNAIPAGWEGLDIGPESIESFKKAINGAGTIIWNGPMGVFEFDKFAVGTNAIAEAVVEATSKGAFSLIGGGDSVAALSKKGLDHAVSFVSTGGGAMLEYLEGKVLPGIKAITG